jgi:Golgi phosphoprotein 3 (GPP34)
MLAPLTRQPGKLSVGAMENLGEELTLLSIRPDKGTVATAQRISYGLMGAELVGLAASGRIEIERDRISVRDASPTGDPQLDTALASLVRARRPARAQAWVGRPRRKIVLAYLGRLVAAGALRAERRVFGTTRYRIADPARVAQTRARLDAIALSGGMVTTEQAAFGGLTHAIGLDLMLYPGRAGAPVRRRLLEMGKGQWTVAAVTGAAAAAASSAASAAASTAAARAASRAATHAATHAASRAAAQAAMDAATHAASQAATRAAAQAASHAATHAAMHAAAHNAQHTGFHHPGSHHSHHSGGIGGF